jgi:hypothetical protein
MHAAQNLGANDAGSTYLKTTWRVIFLIRLYYASEIKTASSFFHYSHHWAKG